MTGPDESAAVPLADLAVELDAAVSEATREALVADDTDRAYRLLGVAARGALVSLLLHQRHEQLAHEQLVKAEQP